MLVKCWSDVGHAKRKAGICVLTWFSIVEMMGFEPTTPTLRANKVAFLHAEICAGLPESYNLDEKHQICDNINATNTAIDKAIRKDFETLPDFEKKRLLNMLGTSGNPKREW